MNEQQPTVNEQLLSKTAENLGQQLSQAYLDLAYVKAQNEMLAQQVEALQQALQQMLTAEEPTEEEDIIDEE